MTLDAFVERVIDEITEGKSIPVSPKKDRIKTIIKNATRYFKYYDEECQQFEYIIISSEVTDTELFRAKRVVQLPDCVVSIIGLSETGTWFNSAQVAPDYRKTNFNYHLAAAGDSDAMVYAVVSAYYTDFMRNFIVRTVAFDYNDNTHQLIVKGRNNFVDLVAHAIVGIDSEGMYNSDRFFRYVVGKCKISFGNIFGLVNAKLLGGLDIDIKSIKTDGIDLVKEVKEELDEQRDSADFYEEF
jgi:hypothetical protein